MNYLLKDVVSMFGSVACQNHFSKRNRFTSMDIEASLIKTMKQHYDVVEKVKIGRKVYFNLEGKKEEMSAREDKRVKNGKWSTPYTEEIDLMLLLWIVESGRVGMRYRGISTIARETQMQSMEQERIIAKFFLKKESNDEDEEDDLLEYFHCENNNFLKQDLREQFSLFNRHIKNSITRLFKNELLLVDTQLIAKMLHPDTFIYLNAETEKRVKDIKKNISSDLGLSVWTGESSFYKKEAIEYRKKSHKEIEELIVKEEDLNEKRRLEFLYEGYCLEEIDGTGDFDSHPVFKYLENISKKYTLDLLQDYEASIKTLSENLNKSRVEFIKQNLTKKYELIKSGLPEETSPYSPRYDSDFGDQSVFSKSKRNYREEYHQMIYSGYIYELLDQMLYTFHDVRPFKEKELEAVVC